MIHIRKARPAEREMVADEELEYIQLHDAKGNALDEWIHFDPATRWAIKGPRSKAANKQHHTGSMKQVELDCHDCGAGLRPSDLAEGLFVCGRLDPRDPTFVVVTDPLTGRPAMLKDDEAPAPKPNSVIECGRIGL